jgi:hypothetical protein
VVSDCDRVFGAGILLVQVVVDSITLFLPEKVMSTSNTIDAESAMSPVAAKMAAVAVAAEASGVMALSLERVAGIGVAVEKDPAADLEREEREP